MTQPNPEAPATRQLGELGQTEAWGVEHIARLLGSLPLTEGPIVSARSSDRLSIIAGQEGRTVDFHKERLHAITHLAIDVDWDYPGNLINLRAQKTTTQLLTFFRLSGTTIHSYNLHRYPEANTLSLWSLWQSVAQIRQFQAKHGK